MPHPHCWHHPQSRHKRQRCVPACRVHAPACLPAHCTLQWPWHALQADSPLSLPPIPLCELGPDPRPLPEHPLHRRIRPRPCTASPGMAPMNQPCFRLSLRRWCGNCQAQGEAGPGPHPLSCGAWGAAAGHVRYCRPGWRVRVVLTGREGRVHHLHFRSSRGHGTPFLLADQPRRAPSAQLPSPTYGQPALAPMSHCPPSNPGRCRTSSMPWTWRASPSTTSRATSRSGPAPQP